LPFIQKVLNFILLEVMFYLLWIFRYFASKYGRLLYSVSIDLDSVTVPFPETINFKSVAVYCRHQRAG